MAERSSTAKRRGTGPSPLRYALAFLAAALVYRFFADITRVLLVLYAAASLAVVLNTVVRRIPLERKMVTGAIGLLIVLGLGGVLWFGGSLLLDQLRGLIGRLPEIREEIDRWAAAIRARTGIPIAGIGSHVVDMLTSTVADGRRLLIGAQSVIGALLLSLVVLAGGLFALAKPNDRLLVPALRAVPPQLRDDVRRAGRLLADRLLGWLRGQLLAMAAVGVLATIALSIIGVPYALLLGVLNAFTEFIPLVGPWLGGVPAVIVAAVDDPTKGVWTAAAMFGIQALENAVILPMAMSGAAKVHPFVTLFALLFFGSIFGLLGILLAIPIVLLVWTLIEVFWVERILHAEKDRIAPLVHE